MEVLLVEQPTCGFGSLVPYSKMQAEGIYRKAFGIARDSSTGRTTWLPWLATKLPRPLPRFS